MKTIICLTILFGVSLANDIRVVNKCHFTVWPGIVGNSGHGQPDGGGLGLGQNERHVFSVANNWEGRVWGRTKCTNGKCETGDCGEIKCNGKGPNPPVTFAEISLGGGASGRDYYDISLVNGYNLPMQMHPIGPYNKTAEDNFDCEKSGCNAGNRNGTDDLNTHCPSELAVHGANGKTVACMSACMKFNTDEYCCRGAHNTPQTCKSTNWPKNYPAIFKESCPDAYTYPFDTKSTFSCQGDPETRYEVIFCP